MSYCLEFSLLFMKLHAVCLGCGLFELAVSLVMLMFSFGFVKLIIWPLGSSIAQSVVFNLLTKTRENYRIHSIRF